VLLRRRPEKGLLGGMTEIPSTPWRTEPWSFAEAVGLAPTPAPWSALPGTVKHGFTHFRLELAVLAGEGNAEGLWSRVDRLGEHALPTLMKKLASHAISALAGPYNAGDASNPDSGSVKSGNISSPARARRTGAKDRR